MIIVTGGAGFIGSNIVKALNKKGKADILVVDDLKDGRKFKNIVGCNIMDYLDKDEFLTQLKSNVSFADKVKIIFHQGACSDTTEWNGKFMMENNYDYSKTLLQYCLNREIALIYASSAAVYGAGSVFKESVDYEKPLNMYGYSKFLFDQYVRRWLPKASSQIVGTRYFNVYGPGESHKGAMASVVFHHHEQMQKEGVVKLFEGYAGFKEGEQRRDFIYVDDVVDVNLWLMENPQIKGIYNVGTGRSQTFNEVGRAVIAWHQKGRIQYIPFPENLKTCYQSYTEADITTLRQVGYEGKFKTVEEGVKNYLSSLE